MSHSPPPAPRPALRKAADGSVHPASATLSSLAVTLPPGGDDPGRSGRNGRKSAKKSGKSSKSAEPDEVVELVVQLPRSVRKALRRRASDYGWTAEEAAAHVLRVWADH
jgi:hypothetical protein